MKLEAVTVCVDYADMLAETLPLNRGQFDKMIVVTAPEDLNTQRICRYWNVPMVLTDQFRSRWGEFHKAKGINLGLKQLSMDDWVVHLDADIALPPNARDLIERADLQKWCLYGVDRFQVRGFEEWRQHQAMPALQQDSYHVHLDAFPIIQRFSGARMGGYAPPGYFQLWNPNGSNVREYPAEHDGAQKTDVLFTANWWRRDRHLLPEFVAYHLESEPSEQGANWDGRVTARFGPEPDWRHRPRHHHHRHRPPPDPYEHHHHHRPDC